MSRSSSSETGKFAGFRNRLGLERSPYLLQHANNPVDWYAVLDQSDVIYKSHSYISFC